MSTTDGRIPLLIEAAVKMRQGCHDVVLPVEGDDDVARLGRAMRDLSDSLRRCAREREAQRQLNETVNAGLTVTEVLDRIYDTFRPYIPYQRIGLSLLEDNGRVATARWVRSDGGALCLKAGYSAPMEGSSLARILETGEPRVINDLEEYLFLHPESHSTKLILEEGFHSSFTCPLVVQGKPVGFLFFSSMERDAYRHAHVGLYMHLALQLSIVIEKGRLYQDLMDLNALKSRFLGLAAHDLRSPLAVVKGYVQVLLHGSLGPIPAPQQKVLAIVERNCNGVLALINDLLDFSAIESGHFELGLKQVDLQDFVESFRETEEMLATPKGIALRIEMDSALRGRDFLLDPRRIRQVLGNLVSNALKFSMPGTTICLRVTSEKQDLRFEVVDEGQGIPAEDLSRLFQEFGRARVRPTAGESSTGLGLAICRRIVQAHGGRIWVESQVGVGSTFSFVLPVEPPVEPGQGGQERAR